MREGYRDRLTDALAGIFTIFDFRGFSPIFVWGPSTSGVIPYPLAPLAESLPRESLIYIDGQFNS